MMRHGEHTSQDYSFERMTKLQGADEDSLIQETEKQWGGFISIPYLKRLYDEQLSVANQGEDAHGKEEEDIHNK